MARDEGCSDGHAHGAELFEMKKVAFKSSIEDTIAAVRAAAATGATLEETKERVITELAPRYEKRLSTYGDYRPWRKQILGNIERIWVTAL